MFLYSFIFILIHLSLSFTNSLLHVPYLHEYEGPKPTKWKTNEEFIQNMNRMPKKTKQILKEWKLIILFLTASVWIPLFILSVDSYFILDRFHFLIDVWARRVWLVRTLTETETYMK